MSNATHSAVYVKCVYVCVARCIYMVTWRRKEREKKVAEESFLSVAGKYKAEHVTEGI